MRRRKPTRIKDAPNEAGPLFSGMLNLLNSLLEKPDTNTLFDTVAQSLRKILKADCVFFVEYTSNPEKLQVGRYSGPSLAGEWGGTLLSREETIAGQAIAKGDLVWTSDIRNEDYFCKGIHDAEGLHAFCAAPLYVNDEIYGALAVSWHSPRELADYELALITIAADRIAESIETIDALEVAKRYEELVAGYNELEALATKPAKDKAESTRNSYQFLKRLEEIIRVKAALFVTDTKKAPKGSPLRAYYPPCDGKASGCVTSAPYEVFKKFADSKDKALSERLEDNEGIQRWAQKHYGISHGLILSNRRVLGSLGCLVCGRPEGEPRISEKERVTLLAAANDLTLGSIDRLLKFEETKISHALQDSLANEVSSGPQFSVEDFYLSATYGSQVGGDFYQVFETSGDHLVAVLGDVSGKGVNLASLGFLVKNVISSYLERDSEMQPAEVMKELNEILYYAHDVRRFISLVLLVVDKRTGQGSYCCAGHPPALLYRMASGACEPLDTTSPIVGALNTVEFKNQTFTFEKDDVLLLYTDGATEARAPNDGREFFGEKRVQDLFCEEIEQGFEGVTTRMFHRIKAFTGGQLGDDMALLALRYNGDVQ